MNQLTPIALEPVDGVETTILVDNLTDVFMPDEGPAKRFQLTSPAAPRQAASTLEGRQVVGQLRGEHGFSALVTLTAGDRTRRVASAPTASSTTWAFSNWRRAFMARTTERNARASSASSGA